MFKFLLIFLSTDSTELKLFPFSQSVSICLTQNAKKAKSTRYTCACLRMRALGDFHRPVASEAMKPIL